MLAASPASRHRSHGHLLRVVDDKHDDKGQAPRGARGKEDPCQAVKMERLVSKTSLNSRLSRREPSVEASVELSDTAACGSNGGVTVRHLKSLLARADLKRGRRRSS